MKTLKTRLFGILGAVGLVFAGGLAIAQVTLPYITSIAATDAFQVIKGGAPQAGNVYATFLQMQSSLFTSNSQHGATTPVLTSCGTSPAISGTDWAGTVTMGTGTPTACTITFGTAYTSAPTCVVTSRTAPATTTPAYTVSTAAITLAQAATSSNLWDYVCVGKQGG